MWTLKVHLNSKDEFGHDIKEVNSITVQHGQLKTLYDRLISFYVAEAKSGNRDSNAQEDL
jgi:hypothetical protein